jgi:hypothetical protein
LARVIDIVAEDEVGVLEVVDVGRCADGTRAAITRWSSAPAWISVPSRQVPVDDAGRAQGAFVSDTPLPRRTSPRHVVHAQAHG